MIFYREFKIPKLKQLQIWKWSLIKEKVINAKKFKSLDNFFFEKGQNPSFLYTPYVVVTEEGDVCLLEKLYRRTLDIPCSKKVSCS